MSLSNPARRALFAGMLAALLLSGACAGVRAQEGAVFVVVRHAEKSDDGTRDPPLSAEGGARAQALARRFADTRLVAAYATPFRRTQETARPAAALHGVALTTYDPATPAVQLAARLRSQYPHGVVLVVGHSNTVPEIVAALCTCRIAALGEDEYDAIYTIRVTPDGRGVLDVGRQSAPVNPPR
jgi:broad specificity phosphatase PhoE